MSKLKKLIPSVAKLLLFAFLFLSIYDYTNDALRGSNMSNALPILAEQPNETYDVILAGSSHMQLAIHPAQLFAQYGIASCNTASASQSIPTSYFIIKEMIDRHSPEVVVLDLFRIIANELYSTRAWVHEALDGFPLSISKIEAINTLIDEGRDEYYISYLLYHGRWKNLEKADYRYEITRNEKYQFSVDKIQPFPGPFVPVDEQETEAIPEISKQYLEKIIQLCKETDTKLLFTVVPYRADVDMDDTEGRFQKQYNSVAKLAEEYGVGYLNSLHFLDEMGFDFTQDMVDPTHVNALGSEKVSEFYGKYLVENYDLPDRSQDRRYSDWHEDCQEYMHVLEEKKNICKASIN